MLSRVNGVGWMEGEGEEGDSVSWSRDVEKADELSLPTFKSMLDDDWNSCYLNPSNPNPSSRHSSPASAAFHMLKDIPFPPPHNPPPSQDTLVLHHPLESYSSSPSSIFSLDPSRPSSLLFLMITKCKYDGQRRRCGMAAASRSHIRNMWGQVVDGRTITNQIKNVSTMGP